MVYALNYYGVFMDKRERLLITMVFTISIVSIFLTSLTTSSVEDWSLRLVLTLELGALIAIVTMFGIFYISINLSKRPKIAFTLFLLSIIITVSSITRSLNVVLTFLSKVLKLSIPFAKSLLINASLAFSITPVTAVSLVSLLDYLASKPLRLRRKLRKFMRPVPKEVEIFVILDLVSASLFTPSLALGLYVLYVSEDLITMGVGAGLFTYGLYGILYFTYGLLRYPVEVKVKVLRGRWYTAFMVRHPRLFSLVNRYAEKIKRLLRESGTFEGPLVYASKYLAPTILYSIAVTPIIIALPFIVDIKYVALIAPIALTIPLALLVMPILQLSSRKGDRKRMIEDELAWFTLFASIMQSAGLSLYESFRRIIGKKVLPAMEREAMIIERNVRMLGMDQLAAIEEVARYHPSRKFSEFLYGYTAIMRTGGDLVSYLESRVKEYLEFLKFKMRRYAERSVDLGEVLISLFFILTSIIVSIVLVSPETSATIIHAYNYAIIPVVTVVMYSVINTIQPKLRDKYMISHTIPAIMVPLAVALALYLKLEPWLIATSFIMSLAGGYGIQYYVQQREVIQMEHALTEFLRDITEYRKVGLPVSRAIIAVAERRSYNKPFNILINYIATALKMNRKLSEIHVPTKSWLSRIVFFMLGQIEETGGGTIKVMEELTNFVQEYNIARQEMRSTLRLYEALAYVAPVMLVMTTSLITSLTESFGGSLTITSLPVEVQSTIPVFKISPELMNEIKMSTLLASTALAVLTSKTVDYTIRNTLRALAVIAITMTCFYVLDPMVKQIISTFFSF